MKYFEQFRVKPGHKVSLADIDPDSTDGDSSRSEAAKELKSNTRRLRTLQEQLYAEHKRSVLICLQAIDAGGKDGTIRHVMSAMNPQGCKAVSFREPSRIELEHDFLWRVHVQAPAFGEVAIFNRSHYEDVIVPKAHDTLPKKVISARYEQINAFEELLVANHTHILKFFLHISKEEQLKRFKARLDDPTKQWKISLTDYTDRQLWDAMQEAFELALTKCSSKHAPWFIIPANRKWFRNLTVSRILVEYLEGLKMTTPAPSVDLARIRQEYHDARPS